MSAPADEYFTNERVTAAERKRYMPFVEWKMILSNDDRDRRRKAAEETLVTSDVVSRTYRRANYLSDVVRMNSSSRIN